MNVLQILPELNVGGVETGTLDLAKYLVRNGHKAVVVSSGGELVKELEASGAIHYKLSVRDKSIFNILKMVKPLAEIIRKEKIDIVHARSRVPAWVAYFATRSTGTVFITTCHGYYSKHPFSYVMGWAKRVIVLSNVIARHMIDDFAIPHERVRLVPRSVDLEKFKYTDPLKKRKEEFNVGIIARITPLKGHMHFIKAMAKVARSIPRIKVWIVGDASGSHEGYKEQLQVLVRRLGLAHCTEFLGTQRDIPGILEHLDLLVLATTTHEAFGRVIIEAQASGVPVVATEVGGVVDIIEDNKTGLLVAPADAKAMAEAIIRVAKDPELARSLSEHALKKVKEKYNVELMVKNTLSVYEDALCNLKILIIKFSSLGDIILSTAALRAIRNKFRSGYKISFLVGCASKEVLLRSPHIDELLVADFKGKDKGLKGLLNLAKELRKSNFDMVIDLQNNRKSHLLAYLSGCLKRFGYENNKLGFLLNQRIKDDQPLLEPVKHQFRILNMLGIELEDPSLELWPSQEDENYVEELLSQQWLSGNEKIVGINISASERWQSKNWPLKNIIRLCDELSRMDLRTVITGVQKDENDAQVLLNAVKGTKPINACSKTNINQLAVLIKRCSIYISPDSASLHIAAAMNVPFIALFGPTDSRRHLPPGKNFLVIEKPLPCSPCYRTECKTNKCMEAISVEDVLVAVNKLLNKVT